MPCRVGVPPSGGEDRLKPGLQLLISIRDVAGWSATRCRVGLEYRLQAERTGSSRDSNYSIREVEGWSATYRKDAVTLSPKWETPEALRVFGRRVRGAGRKRPSALLHVGSVTELSFGKWRILEPGSMFGANRALCQNEQSRYGSDSLHNRVMDQLLSTRQRRVAT